MPDLDEFGEEVPGRETRESTFQPMKKLDLKTSRQRQGAQAKAFGQLFERTFLMSCRKLVGCAITQMPDGCKVLGANRIIRVKTPFDWIVSYQGKTAMIDTKTSSTWSFNFSKIETHQVDELLNHVHAKAWGGYIVWYRETDQVAYIGAEVLRTAYGKRGSFSSTSPGVKLLGSVRGGIDVRQIFAL